MLGRVLAPLQLHSLMTVSDYNFDDDVVQRIVFARTLHARDVVAASSHHPDDGVTDRLAETLNGVVDGVAGIDKHQHKSFIQNYQNNLSARTKLWTTHGEYDGIHCTIACNIIQLEFLQF